MTLVSEMSEEFKPQAKPKSRNLCSRKQEPGRMVQGDPLQLKQALRNLVGMPSSTHLRGGSINLSVDTDEEHGGHSRERIPALAFRQITCRSFLTAFTRPRR